MKTTPLLSSEIKGEGHPLLILHGFTGDHSTMSSISEPLSKNYSVISVDLPGHGNTIRDPESHLFNFEDTLKAERKSELPPTNFNPIISLHVTILTNESVSILRISATAALTSLTYKKKSTISSTVTVDINSMSSILPARTQYIKS